MRDETCIVVPAYNEAQVIRATIEDLQQAFSNIVVVNDGSTDETAAILRELGVIAINHLINIGQGGALQTGITYALRSGARYIVSFDADGQHQVSDVIEMLKVLEQGDCDVVLGSRFLGNAVGITPGRRLLLALAVRFSNMTTQVRLTDASNGLRAFNRKAAACLDISQFGMAHATEIIQQLHAAGMRIREHPVTIHYTDYSTTKGQRSLNAVNVLLDLLLGRYFK
jgi:glycosyltransferase involved in cell wall biosynthesis